MKKLIILFTIVIITVTSPASYGQFSRINVGVNGGPDLSSLRGNKYLESHHSLRTGYAAGVFVQYNFTKTYSLQTGCSYQIKGSAFDYGDPAIYYGKNNFDFLIIPLLVKARSNNKLSLSVCAGGYYGILLKETDTYDAIYNYPAYTIDRTGYFKKYETGITAGFGLSYPLNPKILLSLEVRNNFGLNDINNFYSPNSEQTTKTYSTDFLLGVAYQLW